MTMAPLLPHKKYFNNNNNNNFSHRRRRRRHVVTLMIVVCSFLGGLLQLGRLGTMMFSPPVVPQQLQLLSDSENFPEIHTYGGGGGRHYPPPPDDSAIVIHNLIKKKNTSGGQGQGGGTGGGGGGGGWKMWDQQTHLFANSSLTECLWTEYRVVVRRTTSSGSGSGGGGGLPMCVHKEPDMVSKSIIQKGRWDDCDLLVNMWKSIEEQQAQQAQTQSQQTLVHLEVGANIGACVMQLLMATRQVQILAFEPNPKNLYCLSATLSRLPPGLRSRVHLFPIGLGNTTSEQQIYAEIGNNGNSVVGLETKYRPGVQYHPPIPIFIERLDDILDLSQLGDNVVGGGGGDSHQKNTNTNTDTAAEAAAAAKIRIGVMKLDVQGYECFALEGMAQTLSRIDKIKFEADQRLLKPLGCSFELMSQTFEKSGFTITDLHNQPFVGRAPNPIGEDLLAHNQRLAVT